MYTLPYTQEKRIDRILFGIAILLFISTFFISNEIGKKVICFLIILLAGYELLMEGIKNLVKFNFEESTLMTIAIVAAFILGEFPESCMIILLFRIGEFLE